MKNKQNRKNDFSVYDKLIYFGSVIVIITSFFIFKLNDYLALIASLIGATFLILCAKGNVWGPVLTVVFSAIYGIISYKTAYYGEMITYLCMTAPIAVAAIVSWVKNPAQKDVNEVKVNKLSKGEYIFLAVLTVVVTVIFYFILKELGTSVLWLSTISIFTSFAASYLTLRRSEYYAIAYAANDAVLIGLWTIASIGDKSYISVVICFVVFLVNDMYGFISWKKMRQRQQALEIKNNK